MLQPMPQTKRPADESAQQFWDLVFLQTLEGCARNRVARDPQGCIRLAAETADLAVIARSGNGKRVTR